MVRPPLSIVITFKDQRASKAILSSGGDVGAEDSILGTEIFALWEQALIDRASHEASNRAQLLFCLTNDHGSGTSPPIAGAYFARNGNLDRWAEIRISDRLHGRGQLR